MINVCTKPDNVLNRILGAIFRRKIQMAVEVEYFNKYRSFSDGVDFINVELKLYIYNGDHTPRQSLSIGLINFKLVELTIYNTHHRGPDRNTVVDVPYKMESHIE